MDIDIGFYNPKAAGLDVGDWDISDYEHLAMLVSEELKVYPTCVVEMQPRNGTRYLLLLALHPTPVCGRDRPLSVVWVDSGRGCLIDLGHGGVLVEDYIGEKLGCTLSDGWVIGRFLTRLRVLMQDRES